LAGVVIDGAIRDLADIRGSQLPVFARSVVANAGGAEYVGKLQVPVACGGMVVHPGDWLVGDDDGVVVIPVGQLEETMEKAERIVRAEKKIAKAIRSGVEVATLLRVDELLEEKAKKVFIPQLRVNE
jgi:4-hydroxy-4-methyl-2-oxoglutarate aldolase